MKTKIIEVDAKIYCRIITAFVRDEGQKRAFKQRGICQIGGLQAAKEFTKELDTPHEVELTPLSWFTHPDLQEPVLLDALSLKDAPIILVRLA